MSQTRRPKLCIVSLYSYPLFNPECRGAFGGSEVRISLIARELAQRGCFDVNFVVFDHGQPKQEIREGITFYAHSSYVAPHNSNEPYSRVSWQQSTRDKLRQWLRSAPPPFGGWIWQIKQWLRLLKFSLLYRDQIAGRIGPYLIEKTKLSVYDEVAADLYILPGNSHIAAELVFYCQQHNKKYIFLAGSDGDYQPIYKEQPNAVEPHYGWVGYLLVYAIEHATAHITQSEHQAQLLQDHYRRTSVIIGNPLNLNRTFPKEVTADTILWIGKSDKVKRPEIILNLARSSPEYRFLVIMNLSDQVIHQRCLTEAEKLSNVTILSYVSFDEVERYFAQAKLFINTSAFEGFPNTFLQAAKYEVPIISLQVDPGEMLSRYGCGLLCAGSFESLQKMCITS
ncbi:MAG: glycosyltransferase family 4 protein [Anaerolineales bacterium]|nr:glycosyltransferase family 4 protein [Anaerolineales bacterium]